MQLSPGAFLFFRARTHLNYLIQKQTHETLPLHRRFISRSNRILYSSCNNNAVSTHMAFSARLVCNGVLVRKITNTKTSLEKSMFYFRSRMFSNASHLVHHVFWFSCKQTSIRNVGDINRRHSNYRNITRCGDYRRNYFSDNRTRRVQNSKKIERISFLCHKASRTTSMWNYKAIFHHASYLWLRFLMHYEIPSFEFLW